ncbi:MAG: hydroxyacid dehydrogenase [Acidimicrobiia bacterium]|nr:hydroxyacid dehydrogenase [Acidimicrobiia bacterium]
MRILVADKFPEPGLQQLRDGGHTVEFQPDLSGETLPGAVAGHEVLVVRSTEVDAAVIDAATDLALIVRAGAGTNTIDKKAAAARAIHVSNVPGRNAVAVAELTLGLILAIDRRIADNVRDLRAGAWDKKTYSQGRGLMGRRLGIVGIGSIGLAVASRAAAFGLHLHGIAKPRRAEVEERLDELEFTMHQSVADLAAAVDILSFHVPATAETRRLLDRDLLERLKPGAVIINTSRADVVDEAALLEVIDQKELWVGADVFDDEPAAGQGEITSVLAGHPRVYGTHHIGASTEQAQDAVAVGTLDVIEAFAAGMVINCVNLQPRVPDTTSITVRHRDEVGVLAGVLTLIRDAGINVEHMNNLVFDGATAASATLDLKGAVTESLMDRLRELPAVIHARVNT